MHFPRALVLSESKQSQAEFELGFVDSVFCDDNLYYSKPRISKISKRFYFTGFNILKNITNHWRKILPAAGHI